MTRDYVERGCGLASWATTPAPRNGSTVWITTEGLMRSTKLQRDPEKDDESSATVCA